MESREVPNLSGSENVYTTSLCSHIHLVFVFVFFCFLLSQLLPFLSASYPLLLISNVTLLKKR